MNESMSFLSAAEPSALFISVLSLGELRKGVALKIRSDADGAKTDLDSFGRWAGGPVLAQRIRVDTGDCEEIASLPNVNSWPIDTLLAATALVHKLTLVTRNISDVHDLGVKLLDPWRK